MGMCNLRMTALLMLQLLLVSSVRAGDDDWASPGEKVAVEHTQAELVEAAICTLMTIAPSLQQRANDQRDFERESGVVDVLARRELGTEQVYFKRAAALCLKAKKALHIKPSCDEAVDLPIDLLPIDVCEAALK